MIMAGGAGTRFWPWSRKDRPKQLLSVAAESSMLRRSVARLLPLSALTHTDVVTTEALYEATYAELAAEGSDGVNQALQSGRVRVLAEPHPRNTAACIGFGWLAAQRFGLPETAVLVALPADHFIGDDHAFRQDLMRAAQHAVKNEGVVTIGVPPSRPETGYGYLELAPHAPAVDNTDAAALPVARFREKPNLELAARWVVEGNHLWNTGIFTATLSWWRQAFSTHMPDLFEGLQRFQTAQEAVQAPATQTSTTTEHGAKPTKPADIYAQLPSESVDYGIMEKIDDVWTVAATFPWSDVGTWEALPSVVPCDEFGNVIRGDALVLEGARNVIIAEGGRLVATVGLRDTVVVDTGDAVLVVPRDRAQDVRKIIAHLSECRKDLL